jgi:hypothetical protein
LLSHSTNISVIPSQHKINPQLNLSLITPKGPLHSPPSGDCKSLTKFHFCSVALCDVFSLLQPNAVLIALEAVYTLCHRVDDGVHCSPLSVTCSAILSINSSHQYTVTHKKQAVRELHNYTFTANNNAAYTSQRITLIKCIHYALREP